MTLAEGELEGVIAKLSYAIYRRHKGFTEAADIRQEMWAWWLGLSKAKKEGLTEDRLRWRLKGVGESYARQQKAKLSGYSPMDEYFYSLATLRELLPFALSEDITKPGIHDDDKRLARRVGSAGSGMHWETTMADLRKAFGQLTLAQQNILYAHLNGVAPRDYATRALKALQRKLGGARPYAGRKPHPERGNA